MKTEKQVVSGYHRPVCIKCNCELHPEKNGVGVLDMVEQSREHGKDATFISYKPYALYDADLWKCPKCGLEVVGGFGSGAISRHYSKNFQTMIQDYKSRGLLIRNMG